MEVAKGQSVYIWGLFNGKQFTIPQKMKQLEGKRAINIASGGNFYLAMTQNGQVYGWGATKYNRFSLSGQDVPFPKLIPIKAKITYISAGNWHSMCLDTQGRILSAGHNKQGACGSGSFQNLDVFTPIKTDFIAKYIACGDCYSLVISSQNQLYSCGHSSLHGHKSKDHINQLKKLNINGEKIKTASAGFTHSLAVTQKGQTYSWGNGIFYQLGHGNKQDQKQPKLIKKIADIIMVSVSCTRGQKNSHSMAVSQNGQVYTWGAGYKGKLGHQCTWSHQNPADEPQPRKMQTIDYKVKKVSAGGIHSNILNEQGQILSFGCGSDGRLGHSKSNQYVYLYRQGFPKLIDSLKGIFITNLQSSYYHNICIGYKK